MNAYNFPLNLEVRIVEQLEQSQTGKMRGVFARENIKKDEVIRKLEGDIISQPTRTSIQIGKNRHIEDKVGEYINHSCNPTARVCNDTLISNRDVKEDEEITIDYNLSEDLVSHPFICNCCSKVIAGRKSSFYKNLLLWVQLHIIGIKLIKRKVY